MNVAFDAQVAYGIEAEVDVCPYAEEAMTLMDYRTNYLSKPDDLVSCSTELSLPYSTGHDCRCASIVRNFQEGRPRPFRFPTLCRSLPAPCLRPGCSGHCEP